MQTRVQTPTEANKQPSHSAQHPAQLVAEQQGVFEDHSPQAAQLTSLQAMMSNSPPQHRTQAMQAKMNGSAQAQQMRTLKASMASGDMAQREEVEEPLHAQDDGGAVQREEVATASDAPKLNNTGLPDNLKSGIESLSGMSMDHVKVHYNSSQPAQLNAHAYAQGSEIHVAPGQEQHVPHEAWHVVQQAQGRVKPTMQMKGKVNVNDDAGLEKEADVMGAKALKFSRPIMRYAKENTLGRGLFSDSFNGDNSASVQRKCYAAKATFGSVIQRVYLNDGYQITYVPPTSVIPPGYVWTGMHSDGVHGPDQLYQHPDLLSASHNPHFQQLGFGKHHVEDAEVEAPEEVVEKDPGKASAHHVKSIREKLTSSKKHYMEEDVESSDSEDEVGYDPETQRNRRFYKAGQLGAIGKSMFPLSDDEMEFHQLLGKRRKRDNDQRGDRRDMYAPDTRKMFTQIGQEFRKTSLAHNPYFRRSFRGAVPKKYVKSGGSKNYNSQQGGIRKELHKVVRKDNAKMKWRREDFTSDSIWKAVQHLIKEKLSNASKGDTFAERLATGKDTSGSSGRVAFHHGPWKEAMGGEFEEDALNPYGLTALNDSRELLNSKKREKLKVEGKAMPKFGAHDAFGHQGSGFLATQKGEMKRSKGGGQFVDMDAEAVDLILKPMVSPRVKKGELYSKSAKKKPADPEQRKKMERFAVGIQATAQQLERALATQNDADDLHRTQFRGFLHQVYALLIPGVNLDDPANVAYLNNMDQYLNTLMLNARNLLRRQAVHAPANPLGPMGNRLPALEQFFAECGQMAAHNALALATHPNLLHPATMPAIHDEAALTAHGNFANNITENQIRTMVATAGRPDIPVVGNIGQVQNIAHLIDTGNIHGLEPFMLNADELTGIQSIRQFIDGTTDSLVMVVNTTSHKGDKAVGYHWITVRFTRQQDGQLAIHFLDSLVAPADYTALFNTLRTFLVRVPAQAPVLPALAPLPPSSSSSGGSTTVKPGPMKGSGDI